MSLMPEFQGWGRGLVGAIIGAVAAFAAHNRTGSAWWWLIVPLFAIVFAYSDDEGGSTAD
jgi:hypothetical protein